jgi:hypothetical protein
MTSNVPDRTKVSTVSKACSAASGCTNRRSQVFTPMPSANCRSSACSASTKDRSLKIHITTPQVEGNSGKIRAFHAETISACIIAISFYISV